MLLLRTFVRVSFFDLGDSFGGKGVHPVIVVAEETVGFPSKSIKDVQTQEDILKGKSRPKALLSRSPLHRTVNSNNLIGFLLANHGVKFFFYPVGQRMKIRNRDKKLCGLI